MKNLAFVEQYRRESVPYDHDVLSSISILFQLQLTAYLIHWISLFSLFQNISLSLFSHLFFLANLTK